MRQLQSKNVICGGTMPSLRAARGPHFPVARQFAPKLAPSFALEPIGRKG